MVRVLENQRTGKVILVPWVHMQGSSLHEFAINFISSIPRGRRLLLETDIKHFLQEEGNFVLQGILQAARRRNLRVVSIDSPTLGGSRVQSRKQEEKELELRNKLFVREIVSQFATKPLLEIYVLTGAVHTPSLLSMLRKKGIQATIPKEVFLDPQIREYLAKSWRYELLARQGKRREAWQLEKRLSELSPNRSNILLTGGQTVRIFETKLKAHDRGKRRLLERQTKRRAR